MAKNRKPKLGQPPGTGRAVRVGADAEYWRTQAPVWNFKQMVRDGPYGWNRLDMGTALAALAKLDTFVSMSWHDILSKTGSHEVAVSEIPNDRVKPESPASVSGTLSA